MPRHRKAAWAVTIMFALKILELLNAGTHFDVRNEVN